jgi:hypothetical protein
MRKVFVPVTLLSGCVALAPPSQADPPSCERLADLALPQAKIASAQIPTPATSDRGWTRGGPSDIRRK